MLNCLCLFVCVCVCFRAVPNRQNARGSRRNFGATRVFSLSPRVWTVYPPTRQSARKPACTDVARCMRFFPLCPTVWTVPRRFERAPQRRYYRPPFAARGFPPCCSRFWRIRAGVQPTMPHAFFRFPQRCGRFSDRAKTRARDNYRTSRFFLPCVREFYGCVPASSQPCRTLFSAFPSGVDGFRTAPKPA